jgi:hypothetical protein
MMKKALVSLAFVIVVSSLPAAADDASLKFKRGIGVIPVTSVTCVPSATLASRAPIERDSDSDSECRSASNPVARSG